VGTILIIIGALYLSFFIYTIAKGDAAIAAARASRPTNIITTNKGQRSKR
jgi:hypothetical protein